MTHSDSSSLTPTASSGNRNRPLLPHFEQLLASLQVRKYLSHPPSFVKFIWFEFVFLHISFLARFWRNIFFVWFYLLGFVCIFYGGSPLLTFQCSFLVFSCSNIQHAKWLLFYFFSSSSESFIFNTMVHDVTTSALNEFCISKPVEWKAKSHTIYCLMPCNFSGAFFYEHSTELIFKIIIFFTFAVSSLILISWVAFSFDLS